jgi:hypothetical protein
MSAPDHELVDHVSVDLDGPADEAWRSCADVLLGAGEPGLADALLRRYPGCLLASVRDEQGGCTAVMRTGVRITVTCGNGPGPAITAHAHAQLASLLHDWLVDVMGEVVTRTDPAAAPSAGPRRPPH